jgi:hypothetical protein
MRSRALYGVKIEKQLRMVWGAKKDFLFKFEAILATREGKEEQTHKTPRRTKGATRGEDREAENRTPSESAGASAGYDCEQDHAREKRRTGVDQPCVKVAS